MKAKSAKTTKLENCSHRADTKGGHARIRFLEGFLEGSLKEVLLTRVLRRRLVRVSPETEVPRRSLRRERFIEGA